MHIPYKGAGPLMVDLLAGQVDMAFDGMGTSAPQIKAGKLIPLAVTSDKRNSGAAERADDAGSRRAGLRGATWYAHLGDERHAEGDQDRMYKEIVKAMEQPELKSIWAEQGADAGGMPPAEFEKLVHSEIAKWAKVVKDAGAKVDN